MSTPIDVWASGLTYSPNRDTTILRGVDFEAKSGRVTGILGPNGSGKTTLLRLLIGALTPGAGSASVGDQDLHQFSPLARARLLALVEQDAHPHEDLRVRDVIAMGRLPHGGRFAGVDPHDPIVASATARTQVNHLWDRYFGSLSGGERQRVHLARALAQTPRVLLLDEPTNHLDIRAQLDVLDLTRQVATDGASVIITVHDLSLSTRVCDEVIVLDQGQVVAVGPPRTVLTPELIWQVWHVRAQWVQHEGNAALVFS